MSRLPPIPSRIGFADITGLPYVMTALIAAGAIAAALAAAAATLTAIAASLGNDLSAGSSPACVGWAEA